MREPDSNLNELPKDLRERIFKALGEGLIQGYKEGSLRKRTLYFMDAYRQALEEMDDYCFLVKNLLINPKENRKEFLETTGNFIAYSQLLISSLKELNSIESYTDIAPISLN